MKGSAATHRGKYFWPSELATSNLSLWVVEYLCSMFSVYDNLVFLRMPVAQSRLANGLGVSPLWPDICKILFRFLVTWCCTNVEMTLLLRSRLLVVSVVFIYRNKPCPSPWCGQRQKNKPF